MFNISFMTVDSFQRSRKNYDPFLSHVPALPRWEFSHQTFVGQVLSLFMSIKFNFQYLIFLSVSFLYIYLATPSANPIWQPLNYIFVISLFYIIIKFSSLQIVTFNYSTRHFQLGSTKIRLSYISIRFRLLHGQVCLQISQLGAFFHLVLFVLGFSV